MPALLALLAVVVLWNAARYPPGGGYDAASHIEYAEILWNEGRLPGKEIRGYYTPPGFYALAGGASELGEAVGLGEPRRPALLLNAALTFGSALLVLLLARLVFPGRRLLHAAALGFFVLSPVVVKVTAMYHPEPLDLFLSTLALLLVTRMLLRRELGWRSAVLLGVVLGAGQLVRAFSLWTFAAVGVALAVAYVARTAPRRSVATALGVTVLATAVVAGPWYAYQASRYSNPVFDQPQEPRPLWERRPAAFYVDPGLPEVFSAPYRPHFRNLALPTTYSELWGDYFGVFAWRPAEGPPPAAAERDLTLQNVAGVVPTALALGGWGALALLAWRRRRIELVPLVVLPVLGVLGFLYFTVSYPTNDGDVLKATYLLTTAPAWALGFGLALERLARRWAAAVALGAVLTAAALVDLRFLFY